MAFNRQAIDEIRDRVDLLDLIGQHVQLKRAGTAWKGLCPFHREKTPSFTVNPQRQIFHCFGCGAGGDAYKFVMLTENVDFPGAVRLLAQRVGVTLEDDPEARAEASRKDELYSVHEEAAKFFQEILYQSKQAEAARDYLRTRTLEPAIVEAFGLGYAPAAGVMLRWAEKRTLDPALLERAGLLARDEEGHLYDRFRDRLMFPVRDPGGRCVAFSGRILPGDERGSKYLNSPETPIFVKSRVLYAMERARKPMLELRTALLCEGQIDVIRCHAHGFTHAVAGLGTAITEEHARILKRHADRVVLMMDADAAGQNSALRAAGLLLAAELEVHVVRLPQGEDPDSLLAKQGRAALDDRLAKAQPFVEFQVDLLSERHDRTSPSGLQTIATEVALTIHQAPSAVLQDALLAQASRRLGGELSPHKLRALMPRRRRGTAPLPAAPPPGEGESAPDPGAPAEEKELCRLLVHHPEQRDAVRPFFKPALFTHPTTRALAALLLQTAAGADDQLHAAARENGEACVGLLAELATAASRLQGGEMSPLEAARELVRHLYRREVERQLRSLLAQRDATPREQAGPLTQRIAELKYDLVRLRKDWAEAKGLLEFLAGET